MTLCWIFFFVFVLESIEISCNQGVPHLLKRLRSAVALREIRSKTFPLIFNTPRGDRGIDVSNRFSKIPLFDGDILISQPLLKKLVEDYERNGRKPRQAYKDRYYPSTIWQEGVPYEFSPRLPEAAVASLKRAMLFWQTETCVSFHNHTKEEPYLLYTGNLGCYSTVGRDTSQAQQIVNIGPGCYHFGVTSHEVAHALGLFHHQQRYDRDDYVKFNKDNVPQEYWQNFAIVPKLPTLTSINSFLQISSAYLSTYDLPYDVGSVMHYTPTEFSKDNRSPALTTLNPNLLGTMGSMDKPSFLDVQLINKLYRCIELRCNERNLPACINGGYPNPRMCHNCKCPSGFGGNFCQKIESSAPLSCGGLIPAKYNLQRLKIRLTSGGERRQCVYQIRAPENRRLVVGLQMINGKCQEGCYTTGMEIKMKGDFRPVGYRFCCKAHSFRRMLSRGEAVPLIFYATNGTLDAIMWFRWVDDTPYAEDSNLLSESEMSEIYKQTSPDNSVDLQILGDVTGDGQEVFVPPPDYSDYDIDRKPQHDSPTHCSGIYGSDGELFRDFSVYT